jgi:hypothetical protein
LKYLEAFGMIEIKSRVTLALGNLVGVGNAFDQTRKDWLIPASVQTLDQEPSCDEVSF